MDNRKSKVYILSIPLRLFFALNILTSLFLPTGTTVVNASDSPLIKSSQLDTTEHTIIVDGELTEWSTDEFMETDNSGDLYLTWDTSNLYVGLGNVNIVDNGVFFVYIDSKIGGTTIGYNWNGVHILPFAADYGLAIDTSGNMGWIIESAGSWTWTSVPGDTYVGWSDNPNSEFEIPFVAMQNPTYLHVSALFQNQSDNGVTASWPASNPANNSGSETFTHHYHFPSLVSGISPQDSVLAGNILINEFHPKGTEYVELYNPTDQAIDLYGWYLNDAPCSAGISLIGFTTLLPGAYFVINTGDDGDNFDLSNDGDYIYLCSATNTEIDSVAYGTSGGAPLSHTVSDPGHSTARTPNGTDTNDNAIDWNIAVTPSPGSINNAPAVLLGSNLLVNEFDNYPSSGNDKIEIFNPTDQVIDLNGWLISDGDGIAPIVTSPIVQPGHWVILEETIDWTYIMDISSYDVGYLFQPNGIRVDQLGWNGEYEDNTLQRIGDGEGSNSGYNWISSGGGLTLFDLPSTLGYSNASPVSLEITKKAPLMSYPGHIITYTISVKNESLGSDASGVVVTDTVPEGTIYAFGGDIYANGVVTFTIPNEIDWGDKVEYTFGVTVTAGYGTVVINNHYGVDSNETIPIAGDPVTTTIFALDLSIDKHAPNAIPPESEYLSYGIAVINTGVISATNVTVTDTLPLGTSYLDNNSGIVPINPSPGVYVWSLGDLQPDTGKSFNITVTVDITTPGTILENTAVVHTDTPNDSGYNNTDTTSTIVYLPIHTIQGLSHISPYNSLSVEHVYGIVTVVRPGGFYMQDPLTDEIGGTSEAIYIYTGSSPGLNLGDEIFVAGTVSEYRPGGSGGLNNLTLTEITDPTITVLSTSLPLPTATVIGNSGRIPPADIIDNDSTGDVEIDGIFDPEEDGIDFYESLESMLVQINDAISVAPTNYYHEIAVVGDSGANADILNPRGSIVVHEGDFNPERILIDDTIISDEPQVDVGAVFNTPVIGVLDYTFGNFKLFNTTSLDVTNNAPSKEVAEFSPTDDQLTVATFNVYNLDPSDDISRFESLADQIVSHLLSPDIIALEEMQDNNGPIDDGTVDADQTFQTLINSIEDAGGPVYEFRQINPIDNQDGGEPGGNIRVGFLFRTDRGLEFVDRPGGDATTPITASLGTTGIELSLSPGRIDPMNEAFLDSRKPLASEFSYNGNKVIVIANHLNSKGGDQPLFGHFQPPMLYSEVQRLQQAEILNNFVDYLLSLDPEANVIVLGDLNDFQFSAPMSTLASDDLTILTNLLPVEERYSYLYDGNAQALDHILVSGALTPTVNYDIVHMNAEYHDSTRPTDHDPAVAIFDLLPANLYVTKSVTPNIVALGSMVTYTISVNNPTHAYAAGLMLTDTLPKEVTFGGWIENTGAIEDGGTITWIGDLPQKTNFQFVFTATLSLDTQLYGETITNTVFLTDQEGIGISADSSFRIQTAPHVTITKSVEAPNEVNPGGVVTYTVSLENIGEAIAHAVMLTDVLPSAMTFGGWIIDNEAQISNGVIFWTGELQGYESLDFIFMSTVNVDSGIYGAIITNHAIFTSNNAGSGESSVSISIQDIYQILLPLIFRN